MGYRINRDSKDLKARSEHIAQRLRNFPLRGVPKDDQDDQPTHHERVALCVLRPISEDVRAQRNIMALRKAGYRVNVVDVVINDGWNRRNTPGKKRIQYLHGSTLWSLVTPGWHAQDDTKRGGHIFPLIQLWRVLWLFLRCVYLLYRLPADVYHACELSALPACYVAARLRHKPLIYEAYELPLHDIPIAYRTFTRRYWHRLLASFLPPMFTRCSAIITVSLPITIAFQLKYKHPNITKIRNVPPYSNIAQEPAHNLLRQTLGLPSTTRIALYQGYLQPDRELATLVRAAAHLAPDIVLVLMGQDRRHTRASLETIIQTEQLSDRVKILPPVPYADLLAWTASANLGLIAIPPEGTLNMHFSLPNKLFEYIMAGLPILSSANMRSVAEIVKKYNIGRLIEETDPQSLGTAISHLLNDKDALEIYHQNTYKAARECCWEREQKKLLNVYARVVTPRAQ
jgi:glycosyltransferase involved in cell wall biosynthesis